MDAGDQDLQTSPISTLGAWSIALMVLGPLAMFCGLGIWGIYGFGTSNSEAFSLISAALVVGAALPVLGACVLFVACLIRREPSFGGGIVCLLSAGALTLVASPAYFGEALPAEVDHRARVGNPLTPEEKRSPTELEQGLETVFASVRTSIPDLQPALRDDGTRGAASEGWYPRECTLSNDAVGVSSHAHVFAYEVPDLRRALASVRTTAADQHLEVRRTPSPGSDLTIGTQWGELDVLGDSGANSNDGPDRLSFELASDCVRDETQ